MAKNVCKCDWRMPVCNIVALLLMAAGLYAIVSAVRTQWNGDATFVPVWLVYMLGLLLLMVGKFCHHVSKELCPMHCLIK